MPMTDYSWWNLIPQNIDDTLITIGGSGIFTLGSSVDGSGFPIKFYGLMYILAAVTTIMVVRWLSKKEKLPFTMQQFEGIMYAALIGVILGGRLGYVLFYNFGYYMQNPAEILIPFKNGQFVGFAGMSFHGALIGVVTAIFIYMKIKKIDFAGSLNIIAYAFPLGYTWGRIGNFLNGELWGRPTDAPIGMLFPNDPQQTLRHPSQLYEAFLEGILLFIVLHFLRKIDVLKNKMAGLYLIGYSLARFSVEFFREPDAHIGLDSAGLSRGQMLSLAMVLAGVGVIVYQFIMDQKNPMKTQEERVTPPPKKKRRKK